MKRHTLILSVAVVLASVLTVSGCSAAGNSSSSAGSAPAIGGAGVGSAPDSPGSGAAGSDTDGSGTAVIPDQQIVTTGFMTLVADRPIDVADQAAALVESAGGHIDNRTEQTGTDPGGPGVPYAVQGGDAVGSGSSSEEGVDGAGTSESGAALPALPGESATLELRIPSEKITATVDALKKLARVQTMSLTSSDVTTQTADVAARITALQTSVDRLLDLLSKSTTTTDLISLENALSSRQADLDSLKAQRDSLSDQTQYATVSLTVVGTDVTPSAAPTDFWGGLVIGWSSMIAAVGAGLVALGVALPWLVVLAVVAALVLGSIRYSRRRARGAALRPAPQAGPQPQMEESHDA